MDRLDILNDELNILDRKNNELESQLIHLKYKIANLQLEQNHNILKFNSLYILVFCLIINIFHKTQPEITYFAYAFIIYFFCNCIYHMFKEKE